MLAPSPITRPYSALQMPHCIKNPVSSLPEKRVKSDTYFVVDVGTSETCSEMITTFCNDCVVGPHMAFQNFSDIFILSHSGPMIRIARQ